MFDLILLRNYNLFEIIQKEKKMKKQRLLFIFNIVTICLSLCAIFIGVYSIKNAQLSITGTIGFKAFSEANVICKVSNATYNNQTYNTLYITSNGISTQSGVIKLSKDSQPLDFSQLSFSQDSTTKKILPLIFTFEITNTSSETIVADLDFSNLELANVKATAKTDMLQIIRLSTDTDGAGDDSVKGSATISLQLDIIQNISVTKAISGGMTLNVSPAKSESDFAGYEICQYSLTPGSIELLAVPAYAGGEKTITLPGYFCDARDYFKINVLGCSCNDSHIHNLDGYENVIVENGPRSLWHSFFEYTNIKSVSLPTSIKYIEEDAFYKTSITSINIPYSVTELNYGPFWSATKLESLFIPSSVISVGDAEFGYTPNLTTIEVDEYNPVYYTPNNCNAIVTRSGNILVVGCKNTVFTSAIAQIGSGSFQGIDFSPKTKLDIPGTISVIDHSAFSHCSGITSLYIRDGVKTIGINAFSSISSLSGVYMSSTVTKIDSNAFYGISSSARIFLIGNNASWSNVNCGSNWKPSSVVPETETRWP